MARPMNLEKRVKALADIVNKAKAQRYRASRIAKELANSFKDHKTVEGKKAQRAIKAAGLLVTRLNLVSKRLPL